MSKKIPQQKGRKSRLPQNVPQLTPDPNFRLTGVSSTVNFRPTTLDYQSQQPSQQQTHNTFFINRPINRLVVPPYQNNQQQRQSQSRRSLSQKSIFGSPESLYRPTMDSLTSSHSNYQQYSPVNRINLGVCDFKEQLYNNPDFYVGTGSGYPAEGYPSQEYYMGQGSAHGSYHDSVPNDDDDDDDNTLSEEMSPVKPKKPTKRVTKTKKNDANKDVNKDTKNDSSNWTCKEEIALCRAWCDTSENSVMGNNMQAKGFWKKVIAYFEKEVGANRTYNSIITKWKNRIRPRVGQFCAIYDNAYKNYASGENDLTVYRRACEENKIVYNHAFTLEHCWKILREHEVWKDTEMPCFLSQDASRKKAKTSETGSDVPATEETLNERPMGRDAAKKNKKKSSESSKSSYMEGVADKWKTIKSMALGKKKELADEYYELKKQELEQKKYELELQAKRDQKVAEMEDKRFALEQQKLEFEREKKQEKDIIFYLTPIDPSLPVLQRQKMHEIKDSIKARHNLDY